MMMIIIIIIFSSSTAKRGLWPPRHTRFLDHTQRRATVGRTPLGRVISSSQRPLPDNKHTQQTNIRAPGGIRTHDRSRRTAVDLRLRTRGQHRGNNNNNNNKRCEADYLLCRHHISHTSHIVIIMLPLCNLP
jgi:hypothetical protein